MTTDATDIPTKPTERMVAGSTLLLRIATNLVGSQPEFIDARTPGAGAFVLEIVTSSEAAARRIAAAVPDVTWDCEADFRPGPVTDTVAWEGEVREGRIWWPRIPVRVVAVLDHQELPVVRHYEALDDLRWLQRERIVHPITDEQAAAAMDAAHRLELVGAL